MRYKVDANRSLRIGRGEREIGRLIWQSDEVAQLLLHGLPDLRPLMHISPARYGASLQGKLDAAGQENLDAAHRDRDVQPILSWLDGGTHQVDHRPTHQCLDRALLKQPHPAVRNRVRLAAQGCERRVASPLRRGRPAGLFWRLCPYHFNGAVGDRCANRTDRRQHGCDQHADDADSQGNLQHGVALVFDADATDVAFVKQLFHGREQLLTHHLEFFAIFWWLSGRRGMWICLCHGCSPISRVLRCGFDLDLGALDTWLVRSRLTVSCCSDGFRGLAARTLCPLLDAQHTFAHHRDVGELHKQAKQDRRREPVVVHAHARNQACLAVILWVKPPVPGSLTFLIPPEHKLVGFEILDIHALFSIWTYRYHIADCHMLELGEDAL